MLRKIFVISVLSSVVMFSPAASALTDRTLNTNQISSKLVALAENDIIRSVQELQNHNDRNSSASQGAEEGAAVSASTAGWLLGLALFGFVALSNRRMV